MPTPEKQTLADLIRRAPAAQVRAYLKDHPTLLDEFLNASEERALDIACYIGANETIAALLELGAQQFAEDALPSIVIAAKRHHLEAVRLLAPTAPLAHLAQGLVVLATLEGSWANEVRQALIETCGRHLDAADGSLEQVLLSGEVALFERLAGARKRELVERFGVGVLQAACERADDELIAYLVGNGVDPNVVLRMKDGPMGLEYDATPLGVLLFFWKKERSERTQAGITALMKAGAKRKAKYGFERFNAWSDNEKALYGDDLLKLAEELRLVPEAALIKKGPKT